MERNNIRSILLRCENDLHSDDAKIDIMSILGRCKNCYHIKNRSVN